jgi:type I restriction enzyme S subunit
LQEQNRIAEALSDVDNMISSLEKLIAKKKAVKQGAMQELLTGKKRLLGFDGEWERILLEDVCIFYNGGTPSKKRSDWWNGSIPWISSSDLSGNSITSVNINRYITQDALDHSATRLCPQNAVSIVSRVGVGKVAVTPCELCTSQDFTTIVSSAHNPYFLAYMLVPIMKDMAMQAQGTSIKGVTVEDIAKIKISTPSIEEQNQIVSILSDMDSEIETMEQKLEKTRQVKQGMMQQLLTGKIRLV